MATTVFFYAFAALVLVSAVLCITRRNPVSAAMWLVSTMLGLAALFVLLGAQFIGIIQVLVYAGAVMVLFLFVIMLLNLGNAPSDLRGWPARLVILGIVGVLAAQLLPLWRYTPERLAVEYSRSALESDPDTVFQAARAQLETAGGANVVAPVAAPMFQTYLVPFEITSVLLLTAIIGAVVLAKRRI